jgi:hypothetical protein
MESPSWRSASRFTVRDAMILVAGLAVSFWIRPEHLLPSIRSTIQIMTQNRSVRSAPGRIALVLSGPAQPVVAVWTLTILVVALSRRHSRYHRLACQPGFVACSSAALAILIVGPLNFATKELKLTPDLPLSVRTHVYLGYALTFDRAECGIAVAAAWLTLRLGGRWRPRRPDWIERSGLALGLFWIAIIPVTRLGPHLLRLL